MGATLEKKKAYVPSQSDRFSKNAVNLCDISVRIYNPGEMASVVIMALAEHGAPNSKSCNRISWVSKKLFADQYLVF